MTKTWNDSRTYCLSQGGDLLVIESLSEYNFMANVTSVGMPTTDWVSRRNTNVATWILFCR